MTFATRHRRRPAPRPQETTEQRTTEQRDNAGLDALLDEIDEALEVHASDFVQNYRQAGGE